MNIINLTLKLYWAILLLLAFSNPLSAFGLPLFSSENLVSDTVFACNELVHISVNENCVADFDADEIVEGYEGDFADFDLTVKYFYDTIPMPIGSNFLGETLKVIAHHVPSGIECWGEITIEDKWAPQIVCVDYDLFCFQTPNSVPRPSATDNCGTPSLVLVAETIDDSDLCTGIIITRTYVAVDASGNESDPCTQTYTLTQIDQPDLPKDTSWSCEVYNSHPNVINPAPLRTSLFSTGSGVPNVSFTPYCGYHVYHEDQIIDGCGGTFSILRTWSVMNWCTGEVITEDEEGDDLLQLIKIFDRDAPVIMQSPFSVNANADIELGECRSTDFLPPANIADNCHVFSQRIITPIGEAIYVNGVDGANGGFIPAPGLEFGEHTIIYEAEDECGNVDSLHVTVTVTDLVAPVPVCDEVTNVSIGALGEAEVPANVFDDGSYDNCCLDTFLVRRMTEACTPTDTLFGAAITLCCADVGDTVTVVFRAMDCFGNFNDCMVFVEVEEKVPPELISCPPSATVDCAFYVNSLEIPLANGDSSVLEPFGWPVFIDNCEIVFEEISVNVNIDQCEQGTITRFWRATDSGENLSLTCTQNINVAHTSDWVVSFPADITVSCGDSIPDTGEPEIFYDNCELIGVSFEDEVFTVVPDACFKIVRTWEVINWCIVGNPIEQVIEETPENTFFFDLDLDGDQDDRTFQDGLNSGNFDLDLPLLGAQPDGYISFQQIIKVNDPAAPVVDCVPIFEVCIFDTSCTADFTLPLPDIMDCSPETTLTVEGDLGMGTGPFTDILPGEYWMVYQVSDNCGNNGFCQTLVEVRDCKAPTPACKNGLVIGVCDSVTQMVEPEILDDGSFDNCPSDIMLSFSASIEDTILMLDCADIGFQLVNLWVTDSSGNQAFCESFLIVDNPCGDCQGPPLVAGAVTTPELEPMNEVHLSMNGTMAQNTQTFAEGEYEFEVEFGGDYTLTPTKTNKPLNGVTTFDLLLITKHILGVEALDSPYKIIAADANKSNAVTTADLLLLRKIVLQIEDSFPDGQTWRFVEKNYDFPNPLDPFSEAFPEVINLNNMTEDELEANFIGVKLGDVNQSADPQE